MNEKDLEENLKMYELLSEWNEGKKFQFFISVFEENESKELVIKEYEKIDKSINYETSQIKNLTELNNQLIAPIKEQYYIIQQDKFFNNKTFIIDLDNEKLKEIMIHLGSVSNHLVKKTSANFHFLLNKDSIREYLVGTDFWEFRTKVFDYPSGDIVKIKFKQMIECNLVQKNQSGKKAKI